MSVPPQPERIGKGSRIAGGYDRPPHRIRAPGVKGSRLVHQVRNFFADRHKLRFVALIADKTGRFERCERFGHDELARTHGQDELLMRPGSSLAFEHQQEFERPDGAEARSDEAQDFVVRALHEPAADRSKRMAVP